MGPVYPTTCEQKFHLKNFLFSRFIVALQGQAFFVFGGKPVLSWLNSPSLNFFIARKTLIIDRFVGGSNERMYTMAYSPPAHPIWILSTFLMLSHTIFSFTHNPAGTFTDFSLPQKHQTVFHLRAFAHVLSTCNFIPSALCSVSLFRSQFKCPLSVRSLLAFYQKLRLQDIWYHNFIVSLLEFFTICNYFVCMCMYFAIFCLLPLDFKIFEKNLVNLAYCSAQGSYRARYAIDTQ